ncbi:hypothetical protein [Cycloclasticus pugetii]|uniref:hypothetical protein n=1 Tax=Cycloclasticus pugetii TaxID=34068 RepID=UPI003A90E23B
MRSSAQILEDISTSQLIEDEWLPLEDLLEELWMSGVSEKFLPILFGVFERYPEDDGAGVLWSILHGVEGLPFDYEPILKESMSKKPSFMGEIMLKRLSNERAG